MHEIKFGTDGWRAVIDEQFTEGNVARVASASARWLKANFENPSALIGHDCRRKGAAFAETAASVFISHGIKVYLAKDFVSTPMISLGVVKLNASLGVIITASHNPPEYSGYKLKGHYGGPLLPDKIKEVEALIPESNEIETAGVYLENNLLEYVDMETMYCEHISDNFELSAIRNSGLKLAFDAMYGSGQNVLKRLLPETVMLHCEHDENFGGVSPEPIMKNLSESSEFIKKNGSIDCTLVTDGDADRIGLLDGKGNFVDAHHIILLLIHYFCKYKGQRGKVCTGISSSVKITRLCRQYGLELEIVPIGFKHICRIMLNEDILLGGEESGGIAIRGHIPERDGIWVGLVLWEMMASTGKSLRGLIDEVYAIVGPFAFERIDLNVAEEDKQRIIQECRQDGYKNFGSYRVQKTEDLDGWKYFLSDNEWVMIRPSGTEPVLRTYAEAATKDEALAILKAAHETIL